MKKTILLLVSFISMSICVSAQSMSDEQVLKYVATETQKGTSQQKMVTELLKKGVTTTQLQRVRRKAEALERETTAKNPYANTTSRTRARQNKADQETQEKEKVHEFGSKDFRDAQNPYAWDDSKGFSYSDPNDSLNFFIEQAEKEERKVFGRNLFNNENLTFQPAANMATPQNYRLGAGDEVHIDIWGASQQSLTETISPDGAIVIEGVGPINLGGKTVAQAKSALKSRLSQFYSDCNFELTVGETRTIQVQVIGEVKVPGTYALNSLCSAFNALYAAGGISEIGTLRNINVFRAGKKISSIDVYEYLMHGSTSGDVRLQDNDVIVVGAYDCLVQIDGKVKRPMWYEMKKGETLKHLMQYSGGFTGDAYVEKVRLTRKAGVEYSVHTVGEFEMGAFVLSDEDFVEVDSVRARYRNAVEVRGAAKHVGRFELGEKIQTVRELLLAADGLTEDAYSERAVMQREQPDLTREMISVDIKGIMEGSVADIPLHKNDVLFIPSKTDMMGDRTYTINGEVRYKGKYPYADNTTIQDFILQAGGLTEAASLAKIDVFRRIRNARAIEDDGTIAEHFTFSVDEQFNVVEDTVFYLKPYDEVVVRRSPAYNTQKNVFVRGEVNFIGAYTMTNESYRLSDLIKSCGGITPTGYLDGAHLTRMMTEDEILYQNEINRKTQVSMYESLIKDGKDINITLADSLLSMRMNYTRTYPVAIDLKKAVEQPGSIYDVVLREGDILEVPTLVTTVKISGEVMSPISMVYEQGKKLKYYIRHAGGYNSSAARSRVYGINMNGSVVKLSSSNVKDIRPGMTIVVPAKQTRNKMSASELMSLTSAGASLSGVIIALMNILK